MAADSGTIGTGNLSRRTLVRTAAWSVPVISTVAAAPAFAAASDTLRFSNGPSGSSPASKTLKLDLTVLNESTTDDTVALQVTVVFPGSYNKPTYVSGSRIGNWSGPTVTGQSFVFTATSQVGKNGGTSPLSFQITVNNSAQATSAIQVQATATGFVTLSTTASAPAL